MRCPCPTVVNRLKTAIRKLGFRRCGSGLYKLNGVRLSLAQAWPTLETGLAAGDPGPGKSGGASGGCTRSPDSADPLRGQLGRPGLWKRIVANGAGDVRCCFELPPAVLALAGRDYGSGPEDEDARPLEAALAWAVSTAGGRVPDEWSQPSAEDIALPDNGLVVQHGRFVRQGRLVQAGGVLALRVPLLQRLEELEDWRAAWLRELLIDGQSRWRMVRLGLDSPEAPVLAEIDLSGAPHSAVGVLVRTSLDALRGIVAWLVAPVDLLANRAVACEALQISTIQDWSLERSVTK